MCDAIRDGIGSMLTACSKQHWRGNARGVSVRGNTLIGNGGDGVSVANTAAGVTIRTNHIFNNGQLGIDLVAAGDPASGATANDNITPPDSDTGPNGLQNFPVITALSQAASGQPLLFTGGHDHRRKIFIDVAHPAAIGHLKIS